MSNLETVLSKWKNAKKEKSKWEINCCMKINKNLNLI